MIPKACKRLAEVDFPIAEVSQHAAREKSIEVRGHSAAAGAILLTRNGRRVAEDHRDCYWLYVVTNCAAAPGVAGTPQGPRPIPVARGQQGAALLAGSGRAYAANSRSG